MAKGELDGQEGSKQLSEAHKQAAFCGNVIHAPSKEDKTKIRIRGQLQAIGRIGRSPQHLAGHIATPQNS